AFDRHDNLVVEMLRIELRELSIGGCHAEVLWIRYVADRWHPSCVEGAAFAREHAAAEDDNPIERAGNRVVEDLEQLRICRSGFGQVSRRRGARGPFRERRIRDNDLRLLELSSSLVDQGRSLFDVLPLVAPEMFDSHAAYCLLDDLRMLVNPVRRSSTARAEEAVTEMSGRSHEHHALRSLTLR